MIQNVVLHSIHEFNVCISQTFYKMMPLFLSPGTGHGAGDEAEFYLGYGGAGQDTVRRRFSTPATVGRPGEQPTTNHRAHRPCQKSQGLVYQVITLFVQTLRIGTAQL